MRGSVEGEAVEAGAKFEMFEVFESGEGGNILEKNGWKWSFSINI